MAFEIGQTVGSYEFLKVLDTSGSGVTYKVRNTLAERLEVLKVLPKELQEDRERVERFLRQVKIHARLTHPNIASFYNAMEVDGQLVMTSELVEGMTLDQRLRDDPVAIETAVDYAAQALSALVYAHENGVVHRNIAPSSLVITWEGAVKVTGFDLAKAEADPSLTLAGVVMGSMGYISPEQVKGVQTLDGRADIYSLGAVLYEVVTGRKLFELKSHFEVMQAHVNLSPAPPSEVRPDAPADLDRIILTALAKEPAERFQSAKEFQEALERLTPSSVGTAIPGARNFSNASTDREGGLDV